MEFSCTPTTCWTGTCSNATRTCEPCFAGWQHSRGVVWNDDCMTPTVFLPVVMISFTVVACLGVVLVLAVGRRARGKTDLVPLTLAHLGMLGSFWGMGLFIFLASPGLYPLAVGGYVAASACIVHVLKRKLLYPAFGFGADQVKLRARRLKWDRILLGWFVTQVMCIAVATSVAGFAGQRTTYNALEISQIVGSVLFTFVSVVIVHGLTRVLHAQTLKRPVTGSTTNYEVECALKRIQGIGRLVWPLYAVLGVNLAFCVASVIIGTVPFADILICSCLVLVQPMFCWWHKLMYMPSRAKPPTSTTLNSKLTTGEGGV